MASCTATVPDKDASGDNLYGPNIQVQAFIDYCWYGYGLSDGGDYWHNGFGYEDPGNTDLPLGRTFNAMWALSYSADDYQNDSYDAPLNILQWGRRYFRENVDDVRAQCGDGSADADSESGAFVDDHMDLYLGFFYSEPVPLRAAVLLHEARHQGGKGHNANFPTASAYGAGQPGADSDWDYQGAWTFEVGYLWWYYAAAARTTSAMKELARQWGNFDIDNAFATHPGFSI
jgi:hypothetical protein